ncbi:nitrogenase-stabilizing/protective protein NifW [Rhodospirillum rubrum]|uniref:Nitrogenase-stabilizing/protective protein NifW n=2 Tax=Rhodospirillum rubrum TaxID=1085 RepID=NIFW_RHORT|nr:nitrogenase-stabilizing/protective protein NifW [Rhodospirillum rubrum]Q2RS27.1 RecName: Full=Nitrogenase-stabilizing/protective protein NifW [Rhodospirillum rubrum ATCC 11170]AAQ62575.1 NifW [Rhodospirillum rubrum]ABC23068.1 Nitrogen fixation protein NifW [Rhodospirillum rubrum ATCC 11170]AEO48797.1 nitrogen fixation protein NifW [Rhodospirillum rubrum F11]MBK5954695.1 nitrogenase-stabilizing/protective protein NifW [Rhodospirillum rubrum]QXG79051.1 nitrogenase-stabilizing/protective prot
MSRFLEDLRSLSSAEEFFSFLGVEFNPKVVQVNRLHILKKYQTYLKACDAEENGESVSRETHKRCLERAYADFLTSDARSEKLFKVFQSEAGKAFVGLDAILPLAAAERSESKVNSSAEA